MNILFVCSGNTCRSAMAAALMNKIATENDMDVYVDSAGIFTEGGEPASENAIKAMRKYGIDLSYHRSKKITPELVAQSDLILVMTAVQRQILEPLKDGKVFTICEYAGDEDEDIIDPYGGSEEDYEETAEQIYDCLVDIAEIIYDGEE